MRKSLLPEASASGLLGCVLAVGVSLGWSADALACGGCFAPPPPPTQGNDPGTVVAAHRMVLSVSTEQTILWDQIQYTGSPKEFAWVLPVKPGARIEVGSDAFFDVLDAATQASIRPPRLTCGGDGSPAGTSCSFAAESASTFGCSADDFSAGDDGTARVAPPDPVHVVAHGSAGPYETVILHADEPDALPKWLDAHGYALPDDIAPLVQSYVAEGFDFAALRLLPSSGVQQMRPVRVVLPGAVTSLPLRMVAAGTGARTAITLFVVSEGRWAPANFPEALLPWQELEWDFAAARSNYSTMRDKALASGKAFFVSYAQQDPLFRPVFDPTAGFPTRYETTEGWTYSRIADAFVRQAFINGETSSVDCIDHFADLADDDRRVVAPTCTEDGECTPVDEDEEIDARRLACDPPLGSETPLDDLGQALVGLHPKDVWVTRMEANLSREALANDLVIEPARFQKQQLGLAQPKKALNLPATCVLATETVAASLLGPTQRLGRVGDLLAALAVGGFGALLVARRRIALRRARRDARSSS